jgi:hypothetical protein
MIAALCWCVMMLPPTTMPGESYRGPVPAMTAGQRAMADRLRATVTELAVDIGERNLRRPDALERAAIAAERYLAESGRPVTRQPYRIAGKPVRNLEIEFAGTESPHEIVVIGAHYDSALGCPAANDNGVAALAELAHTYRGRAFKRTVRLVAFVNEEPPYFQTDAMGSVVYAKRCRERGEDVVAMLSLETIGCYSDAPGSQKYPPPMDRFFPSTGNFIAFVGNVASTPLLKRTVESFRTHAKFPSEGVALPDILVAGGFSDHWAFWQQGYAGLMVTDTAMFRYPHYHEPTDLPDKIDFDRTARVVEGLAATIADLANR